MLFGRKQKNNIVINVLKNFIKRPKFYRTRKYFTLRLQRMRGSPHELAAGFASGIAISFTPFIGIHALVGILFSWIIGGSMVTAVLGTFIGNPWTFPVIWLLTFELGQLILSSLAEYNVQATENIFFKEIMLLIDIFKNTFITGDFEKLKASISSLTLIPVMTIGCIPFVFVSWFLSYFFLFRIIKTYQKKRKLKISKKFKSR